MVDGDSKLFSIEHCRELLGSEADDLSEERITAIHDHADAMAQFIIDLFIEHDAAAKDDEVGTV